MNKLTSTAAAAALLAVACSIPLSSSFAQSVVVPPTPPSPSKPSVVKIPLDNAVPLEVSKPTTPLAPQPIKLKGKLQGWAISVPGGHPIATPAYAHGKLFFGGGYGDYEFYAVDAATGKVSWKYHTDDDGPTAAVVEDGCVAFNTESCTVYVLDEQTGKCLWKEWLGDPLMSQPAISKGRLFMAYPSGQRGHGKYGHALLCADLHSGKHLWNQRISADVVSAPVVEYDRVYVTCMDGTSYCFSTTSGAEIWKKAGSYTSAPLVYDGKLIVSRKQTEGSQTKEAICRIDASKGEMVDKKPMVSLAAPYLLKGATNGTITAQSANAKMAYDSLDGAVGFGGGTFSATMSKATENLNLSSVAGAWGYQGAKAVYRQGFVSNSQLHYVNTVDVKTGNLKWQAEATGKKITHQTQVFSPPSLGKQNMYLCSGDGHIVCLDQKSGSVDFIYDTHQPISFQPALAQGNIYVGTANGMVLCLQTGKQDADGWTAWGGNAQHNKTD
jgi:Ca-activated chloride channel family protein